MKETIYTIPVNDAFNALSECPACKLENDLERSNVEFVTGASLMEPDVRIQMNKKGFCRRHYSDLLGSEKNALGLSLILTSHHEYLDQETSNKAFKLYDKLGKSTNKKVKNKIAASLADSLSEILKRDASSCFICDRIAFTMDKYLDVIVYMWDNDAEFRKICKASKGFCNKHTLSLLESGKKRLGSGSLADFVYDLVTLYTDNWARTEEDLRWFSKKFDYRFRDESWKNSRDALPRTIGRIVGFTD